MVRLIARPTDYIASDAGGWVEPPPISREEAENILGAEVTEAVWSEIEEVYMAFRAAMEAVKNAHTATAWPGKVDRLDKMLASVEAALHDAAVDTVLLDGLASSVERETGATDIAPTVRLAFAEAREPIDRLRAVLAYGKNPAAMPVRSASDAKKATARRLYGILDQAGLPTRRSSKQLRDSPRLKVELSDLTPFERFFRALKIHEATSAGAVAEFLEDAFGDDSSDRRS